MARIIKKAPKRKTTCRTECQDCYATIEFDRKDLKFFSDQRDGDWYEGKCPSCKNVITINWDFVPW